MQILNVEMEWSSKESCKPLLAIILTSPFPLQKSGAVSQKD